MEDEYDHMLHHKNNNNTADAINAYFKNKTDEIIIDFAAGEDCSIVLTFTKTGGQPHQRCGTMLYYFGQLNNRESQPAPEVVYFANPHEVLRTRPPQDPATITKMENENYDFVNFYVDSNRTDFQEAVQHHFQNNNTNDNNKMISNENFVTHLFAGRGNLYYIKTRNDEVYYSSGKHNSRLVTHGGPSNTDLHNYKTFSC
ncbi:hypothetical protein AGDE_16426 [Angomonas deanei]|nr:hypothetical protein AGDE_16426 [Angomonas deanei]|eukprot:EPY17088.1 hypothetical protein AGDE_16426 [Angomonas deanei]